MPYLLLKNKQFRTNNIALLTSDTVVFYLALHLKLASSERSTQLIELFAYENPLTVSNSYI
jgi:hypothetical protein